MTARTLLILQIAALSSAACGSVDSGAGAPNDASPKMADEYARGRAEGTLGVADTAEASEYRGPSVGASKGFAALAYSTVAARDGSLVTGNLGVSGAPESSITGFDGVPALKFGTDSSVPNHLRTILAQREVDALVDDIDARACDTNSVSLGGNTTGVTLHPGVTCLDASQADRPASGKITFDAAGDPNAFFIVRGNFALTVAGSTQVELVNGAQPCAIFWRFVQQVTLGRQVEFFGTVIADTGIAMQSGSTLVGRALSRTAAVTLDSSTITLPVYGVVASPLTCTRLQ